MNGFRASHPVRRRPGFSLVEVLLAVLILGIGVISIAALFPAGIVQQRRSVDDILGPVVANSAMATIRAKVRPGDFGAFEDFMEAAPRYTVDGDWTWLRPAFLFEDDGATAGINELGAIDIFSAYRGFAAGLRQATEFPGGYGASDPVLEGIPWSNPAVAPPVAVITREERYYPSPSTETERPQYVWECMFRRYQGRIQVAVFVYRVNQSGGQAARYTVSPNPSNPDLCPLPIWLNLASSGYARWNAYGPDQNDFADDAIVLGTAGNTFNAQDDTQAWQEARQWLLDQNGNTHRVLSHYFDDEDGDWKCELVNPPPAVSRFGANYDEYNAINLPANGMVETRIVTDIWYLPRTVDTDGDGTPDATLTPTFVAVQDL